MALVANDDTAQTQPGVPVTVNVLANDTLDGSPVQLSDLAGLPSILEQPASGSAIVNVDGTITYTPAPGFVGEVEIPYSITDEIQACSTAVCNSGVLTLIDPPSWIGLVPDGGLISISSVEPNPDDPPEWFVAFSRNGGGFNLVTQSGPVPQNQEVESLIGYLGSGGALSACCYFTYEAF